MPTIITIQYIEGPPFGWPAGRAPHAGPVFRAARPHIPEYARRSLNFLRGAASITPPGRAPRRPLRAPGRGGTICVSGSCLQWTVGRLPGKPIMDEAPRRRRGAHGQLSELEWSALLGALDSDPGRAAGKYETARAGLIRIFRARGFW